MKKNRRVSKKRLTRRRKKKLKSRRRSLQAWLAWAAAEAQRQALAALVNGLKTLSNSGRALVVEDGLNMSCSLNLDKMGRPSWEVSGSQEYPRYSRPQARSLPPRAAVTPVTVQWLVGYGSLAGGCPVQRHASSLPPLPGGTAAHQATFLPPLKLILIQTPDPQNIAPQRPTADCTLWKQPVASVVVFTFSGAINRPPPLPEPERPLPQKTGVDWMRLDLGNLGLYQGPLPGTFITDRNAPGTKRLPCNDEKGSSEHEFVRARKYLKEAIGLRQTIKRFRKTSGYIRKSYHPHKRLFSPKKMGSVKNRRRGYHKPRGYGPPAHRLSRAVSKELLRELQAANSTGCSNDCFTLISSAKQLPCNDKKGNSEHKLCRSKKYYEEATDLRKAPKRFRKTSGRIGKSYRTHKKLFSPKNRGSVKNQRPGYRKLRGYGPPAHRLSREASQSLSRELQAADSAGCSSDCFTLISPAAVSMRQKPSLENCLVEAPEKPTVIANNDSSEGKLPFDAKKALTWREFWKGKIYFAKAIGARKTTRSSQTTKRFRKTSGCSGKAYRIHQGNSSVTAVIAPNNLDPEQVSGRPAVRSQRSRALRKISYPIRKLSARLPAKRGKPWGAASSRGYPSPAAVKCDCRNRSRDPLDYCHNCISVKELSSSLSAWLLKVKQRVLNEGLGVLGGCFRGLSSLPTEYSYWPNLNREGLQKRAIWHNVWSELTVFGKQLQAMADSLAQEEARAVSLLNDYQELPQEVTSTLTPPCQDLSTERLSAKEILRELPVRMSQFKQDVLDYGRGVFEEEFLALRQILATYEQPGLNQEDLAIKEILLEVATEMITFDQQLQSLVPSPLPEQGVGIQDSSGRPPEFDRLFQEMTAFQEQAIGFNNRREMPRVTVTPTLPPPSQELGDPVNT